MKTNAEVVMAFLNNQDAESGTMTSSNGKLRSYATCIAQIDGDGLILNQTKYSSTPSKQLGILRRTHRFTEVRIVDGVPKGTTDLTPYLVNK